MTPDEKAEYIRQLFTEASKRNNGWRSGEMLATILEYNGRLRPVFFTRKSRQKVTDHNTPITLVILSAMLANGESEKTILRLQRNNDLVLVSVEGLTASETKQFIHEHRDGMNQLTGDKS